MGVVRVGAKEVYSSYTCINDMILPRVDKKCIYDIDHGALNYWE